MKKIMLVIALISTLSACSQEQYDLKSPCVGGEGSPCDRRLPANQV